LKELAREIRDALQDAHALHRHGGIAAEVDLGRVGPDDREGLYLRGVEGAGVALVLKEHHGLDSAASRASALCSSVFVTFSERSGSV
jgi:hypothetical protein